MKRKRIVVLGTLASNPYAGMAWMHMQIVGGLLRLGHEVHYFEVTSTWPFDPQLQYKVNDSSYTLPYLMQVMEAFGLKDRWAFRRSYLDNQWFGMSPSRAEELLLNADMVLNVAGATRVSEEGLRVGRLAYFGTDPVYHEVMLAEGDEVTQAIVEEHDEFITYGENIGTVHCRIPPMPRLKCKTRQPVLLDHWQKAGPVRKEFTTICNWKQEGHDIRFNGETYYWSKHHEFLKFIELPRKIDTPLELAMGLVRSDRTETARGEMIHAIGMTEEERLLVETNGWNLTDAHAFSTDPWAYRDYICSSRGEFTVAKDQNVRLRSGWFSERSACYLGAGRPVITQDTGFGSVLPTGEGLFAFNSLDDILAAFESVETDYERHCRAARAIAEEYFRAEKVMGQILEDLGI